LITHGLTSVQRVALILPRCLSYSRESEVNSVDYPIQRGSLIALWIESRREENGDETDHKRMVIL